MADWRTRILSKEHCSALPVVTAGWTCCRLAVTSSLEADVTLLALLSLAPEAGKRGGDLASAM